MNGYRIPGWNGPRDPAKTCLLNAVYAANCITLTDTRIGQIARCVNGYHSRLAHDLVVQLEREVGYKILAAVRFVHGSGSEHLMVFPHRDHAGEHPVRSYSIGDPPDDDCQLVRDKFNEAFRELERLPPP